MYSDLVSYVCPSPNCTAQRTHPVDTITVHHVAGDASVEALGALFADPKRQASSNYGIGSDGRIACFVPEESRSWCSGSRENDMRAITVEVANCGAEPDWPVSEAAWESLVALLADVCKRYGFQLNFTGDKTGNLTMHKRSEEHTV
jgi:N-acetyl-anhydromuramyl-L-alanine amidase AmpD